MTIVLLGALGFAGRFHQAAYAELGIPGVLLVDPRFPPLKGVRHPHELVDSINWEKAIVDVCVPTSSHSAVIRELISAGAKNFIVEKPAAESEAEWRRLLDQAHGVRFFHMNNYLFSRAFSTTLEYLRAEKLSPACVTSEFSKDRRTHSGENRGADPLTGRLPHVFQVELPHQLGLTLALLPRVHVINALALPMILPGRVIDGHGSGTVALGDSGHSTSKLTTSLQAPIARNMAIHCLEGTTISIQFPTSISPHSIVRVTTPFGSCETLFRGADSSLNQALKTAIATFSESSDMPRFSSDDFALGILHEIDIAINLAEMPIIKEIAS